MGALTQAWRRPRLNNRSCAVVVEVVEIAHPSEARRGPRDGASYAFALFMALQSAGQWLSDLLPLALLYAP